jgi:hypothetical protein
MGEPPMSDAPERPIEDESSQHRMSPGCGKIFPLPGEMPRETPDEFASGIGAWTGDVLLALGPDGDLYYTTLCGDGQVHKIVVAR